MQLLMSSAQVCPQAATRVLFGSSRASVHGVDLTANEVSPPTVKAAQSNDRARDGRHVEKIVLSPVLNGLMIGAGDAEACACCASEWRSTAPFQTSMPLKFAFFGCAASNSRP